MQPQLFDPQPLLQVMADSIVADYGRSVGVRLAERAIARLHSHADGEALDIWLNVHALLLNGGIFSPTSHTLH